MPRKSEYSRHEHPLFPVTVIENKEIAEGVFLISWLRQNDFIPGQVMKVAIDRIQPPRLYSICSGNKEERISVLFNVKEEGYLTPKLANARPGAMLLVSEPYGSFCGDAAPAFWIATGTGIAPFYSMFKSGLIDNKLLVHGVRQPDQFYFGEELEQCFGDRYNRCCSGDAEHDYYKGRVTGYLAQMENLPKEYKYYLCGKSLMIVEVRDLLISKGISFNNIYSEIYF